MLYVCQLNSGLFLCTMLEWGGGLDRLYDMVLADAGPVEKLIVFGFHV